MQYPLHARRYTLRIRQHSKAVEPTWEMLLLRPDETLVYRAWKTCTRTVLTDGVTALACAIPGLMVIYDQAGVRGAAAAILNH